MAHRSRLLASALTLALAAPLIVTTTAQAACDPLATPLYRGEVPSPEEVLGFPIGSQEVTTADILTYLDSVDRASDRVTTALAATSVQGRPIRYAVVGQPSRVTRSALETWSTNLNDLRDPMLPADTVSALASSTPRALWMAGNVHGGEESGADASLQVLYDLADRSDCAATAVLESANVLIMPTQNPDGRELETRRNAYGFDMNRDWFARTQPETDGKLEVLRRYPPMLFIDAHEFGSANYLFPPHADPEYHETPDTVHDWIFDLYGPAMETSFEREGLRYFHGAPYDFFASVFGDTVPAVGFHAAGMTFEKDNGDPIADRTREQYVASWTSLVAGATEPGLVAAWHASFVQAHREGVAGSLEPNGVYNSGSVLLQPVPDQRVRHYFVRDDTDRAIEVHSLVRRLQRMDVDVFRLTRSLAVSDFHAYGSAAAASVALPAGTYWIPMAQGQKHWIQSMMHDETWIPTDVTYDVSAWSNPQLLNLRGGWSGRVLSPGASLVSQLGPVPSPKLPKDPPSVAILENVRSTRGFEAAGQLRWLFEARWHLPFADVTPADVRAGLRGVEVLVMPDGYANYLLQDLGAKGKKSLRAWVAAGGRLIAWQGGAQVAARAGVSTVVLRDSHTNMPGSLVRVTLDGSSPLARGIGTTDWVMYADDAVMGAGLGASTVSFPGGSLIVNGLDDGSKSLTDSTVVADEPVGNGRVISFSIDPNFRGWTDGTQRILWNAVLGPDPAGVRATVEPARRAAAIDRATSAARGLAPVGPSPLRLEVASADAVKAARIIGDWGATAYRMPSGDGVVLQVANLRDLTSEEHRFAELLGRLEAAGIDVRWASVP
jgi:hypothetical protein